MDVEYAFLADGAQTSSDGKLYVLGGGIDRITAPSFPVTHPAFALVVKIRVEPSESERDHILEIELWDPDGERIGARVEGQFRAQRQGGTRPSYVQLVLHLMQAQFPREGDYAFKVLIDGHELKSVPLYLESSPSDD